MGHHRPARSSNPLGGLAVVVAMLLLAATVSLPFPAVAADALPWYQHYQRALDRLSRGEAADALADLELAAGDMPTARAEIRTYGNNFLFAYDPAFHRARALLALGRLAEATTALATADEAAVTPTADRQALRAALLAAGAAAGEVAEGSDSAGPQRQPLRPSDGTAPADASAPSSAAPPRRPSTNATAPAAGADQGTPTAATDVTGGPALGRPGLAPPGNAAAGPRGAETSSPTTSPSPTTSAGALPAGGSVAANLAGSAPAPPAGVDGTASGPPPGADARGTPPTAGAPADRSGSGPLPSATGPLAPDTASTAAAPSTPPETSPTSSPATSDTQPAAAAPGATGAPGPTGGDRPSPDLGDSGPGETAPPFLPRSPAILLALAAATGLAVAGGWAAWRRRARRPVGTLELRTGQLRRLGGYQLLRELGRGGMATTWQARRVADGREVALKIPHESGDPTYRERFLREGRLGEELHHPLIVRILDVGEDHGIPFLVMELLGGQTLRALLDDNPRGLPAPRALALVRGLAEALDYAHGKGVIHRDLKPENIMLLPDGAVRVMDFGVARIEGQPGLTTSQVFFGSPLYAAPELVDPARIDRRSDLYSLGAVLWELLTGSPPFVDPSVFRVLELHQRAPVPPPPGHAASVPPEVWDLVRRLLAKDPAERFQSAQELLVAIDRAAWQTEAPVTTAGPPVAGPAAAAGTSTLANDPRSTAPAAP